MVEIKLHTKFYSGKDVHDLIIRHLSNDYHAALAAIRELSNIPAADVIEVVRCKDCKHRPYSTEPGKTYGLTIEAPDSRCPCYNEDDGWYSWVPDNEFFCFYGERKEGEDGQLQDQD